MKLSSKKTTTEQTVTKMETPKKKAVKFGILLAVFVLLTYMSIMISLIVYPAITGNILVFIGASNPATPAAFLLCGGGVILITLFMFAGVMYFIKYMFRVLVKKNKPKRNKDKG